jgi:FtsZ-interacting cell division protein ZipA
MGIETIAIVVGLVVIVGAVASALLMRRKQRTGTTEPPDRH